MNFKKTLLLSLILFVGIGIIACNKDSDKNTSNKDSFDRKAMLTHLANNIILPSYQNFQSELRQLKLSADSFVALPANASLVQLRTQWKEAYLAWQKVEMFDFGPSLSNRNFFNIYPTDVTLIESYVSSGVYDFDVLINNKVQGFPAIDYLLNSENDAGIVAKFAASTNRKKYLMDIIAEMTKKIDPVVTAWQGTYKNTFTNDAGTGAGSALSLMTNEYILYFERFFRSGKYGIPVGAMSGTSNPKSVEVLYSHTLGTQMAIAALNATRDVYLGKDFNTGIEGASFKSYLKALAATNPNALSLSQNIESQFGVIQSKSNALGVSIYDAINSNRASVLDVYDACQQQVRYLKVDLTSAIGISITYTDNDGD